MLIRCGGCEAVHDSRLAACPGCGRCPACGTRRVSSKELANWTACRECGAPYCCGCGRCPGCGKVRLFEVGACACGHPDDPRQVASVEQHFGLS